MGIKERILELREENKIVQYFSCYIKKILYFKQCVTINYETKARSEGKNDPMFERVKQYKGLYQGKRCFIVATGPSLTMKDLELLENEICFGMNSICKILGDTVWRPTFYGIQDSFVYEKLEDDIANNVKCEVFVADNLNNTFNIPGQYIQFPFNHLYHQAELDIGRYFAKFSDDCYSVVYDGYSITYSLMQIAVYMGFTEIYLLGADCNYSKGEKNHFVDSGFVDKNAYKNHDKMIVGYQKAKEYADAHNIKIINCTRGGMLEVYPRMKLEDVLKMEE